MAIFRASIIFVTIFFPVNIFANSIEIFPEKPIQGEPIMIIVTSTSSPELLTFDGKKLSTFSWKGKTTALYGIDLYKKPGTYKLVLNLSDSTKIEKEVTIGERKKVEAPLGIPEKLGGNTATSTAKLVSTLALENAGLLNLRTGDHAFWKTSFRYPLIERVITDSYGYQRLTGLYSIAHKGMDLRAPLGTKILAMNRGVVRVAREGRNYGKTIVLDHGLGLQTFYMHLSKIYVNVGELVLPDQVIGLSGMTGYAENPHLHITVRLNETSIDPEVFMKFFN